MSKYCDVIYPPSGYAVMLSVPVVRVWGLRGHLCLCERIDEWNHVRDNNELNQRQCIEVDGMNEEGKFAF